MIDLTDMNNSSLKPLMYTPGKTSGVLTIGDGTHTSQITFSGSTTQLHNFTVVGSDGHGGTFINFHA